ncbi:TIGR00730 family Rossman fold protein [Candidatus Aerophobetes bacterium]|nr:TIGR00730 family Rossman fold protein [Candidatus Aerophobetes bacterium]
MKYQYPVEEVTTNEAWRVFRIMAEFIEGFEVLGKIPRAVSIFGSTRTPPGDKDYQKAEETARRLAREGYAIVTGGGPGIMEAANKGATMAKGVSVGINIELPREQKPNKYIKTYLNFRYFFVRKVMFVKYAVAFVIFPGGFGTLDEFFEPLQLIQTHKIKPFPLILVGKDYWKGLVDWIRGVLLTRGKISPEDVNLFCILEEPEEIVNFIKEKTK